MKKIIPLAVIIVLFSCQNKKKENLKDEPIFKEVVEDQRSQKNKLDWEESWKEGQGSIKGYKVFGNEEESRRIKGKNPAGEETILWECVPNLETVWDGGFMTDNLNIDTSMPYLFVCRVKKTGAANGKSYFAFSNVEHTTGEEIKNAFFIGGGSKLEELNQWYTMVGYIYPENHKDDIEADVISGLYLNGEKVQEGLDYKWKPGTKNTSIRVVLVGANDNKERLFINNPQLYQVNGTEPLLFTLL